MPTVVDAIADNGGDGTLTVLGIDTAATTVSWATLHERARRMAALLAADGIGPGRRVGLLGDTNVDLVTALQAVWLTGAAITVLPAPAPDGRQGHSQTLLAIVQDAGLDLVLVDEPCEPAGAALTTTTRLRSLTQKAAAAEYAAPAAVHLPDPGDLAILQYTSGSTRTPRGVPVTHGQLAANVAAIKTATDHDAGHPSRTLSWLPLYHDMGLVGFMTLPMSCGCPLVLQSPAAFARRPAIWLDAMSRYRITVSGAPNFAYQLMTRLLAAGAESDLSSLRLLLSGGEPVDAPAMARFITAARRCGLDPSVLVPAYGLAEATLAVTVGPLGCGLRVDSVDPHALETAGHAVPVAPDAPARHLVELGPAVAGTSLRITHPRTGEPVGARTVGHVEVCGPAVVGHYWPDPPPRAGAWLRTGDLGYLVDTDQGRELVVCGRVKDMLTACGRNIFPQDVEAAAAIVSGVRPGGVAAFGIPETRGDRLVVAVESHTTNPAGVKRGVATAVLEEVGLAPERVLVLPVGSLPKTSSGKLRRAETRRRYESGRLTAASNGRANQ